MLSTNYDILLNILNNMSFEHYKIISNLRFISIGQNNRTKSKIKKYIIENLSASIIREFRQKSDESTPKAIFLSVKAELNKIIIRMISEDQVSRRDLIDLYTHLPDEEIYDKQAKALTFASDIMPNFWSSNTAKKSNRCKNFTEFWIDIKTEKLIIPHETNTSNIKIKKNWQARLLLFGICIVSLLSITHKLKLSSFQTTVCIGLLSIPFTLASASVYSDLKVLVTEETLHEIEKNTALLVLDAQRAELTPPALDILVEEISMSSEEEKAGSESEIESDEVYFEETMQSDVPDSLGVKVKKLSLFSEENTEVEDMKDSSVENTEEGDTMRLSSQAESESDEENATGYLNEVRGVTRFGPASLDYGASKMLDGVGIFKQRPLELVLQVDLETEIGCSASYRSQSDKNTLHPFINNGVPYYGFISPELEKCAGYNDFEKVLQKGNGFVSAENKQGIKILKDVWVTNIDTGEKVKLIELKTFARGLGEIRLLGVVAPIIKEGKVHNVCMFLSEGRKERDYPTTFSLKDRRLFSPALTTSTHIRLDERIRPH
jgi:hypothetical protein